MADFRRASYKKGPSTAAVINMIARSEGMRAAQKAKRQQFLSAARLGARMAGTAGGRRRQAAAANARTGGLLGMELKFLDEAALGVALTAPTNSTGGEIDPTVTASGCIGCPAQGDGASNRDGRSYVVKSVLVQGFVRCDSQANQTGQDEATSVFLALVQDTQTNGAQLNSEDVYTNVGASALTAAAPFRNLSYAKRFIVHDWCKMDLQQPSISWDGTNMEQGGLQKEFSLKFNGSVKVICSGTTQNVNQVQDNSWHVVGFCTNTNLAPYVSYNARTRFVG